MVRRNSVTGGVWDDFRNWLQLDLEAAKGHETRKDMKIDLGQNSRTGSGEVEISLGAGEAEQLCDPERT